MVFFSPYFVALGTSENENEKHNGLKNIITNDYMFVLTSSFNHGVRMLLLISHVKVIVIFTNYIS